jgi:hypothetical protein
LTPPHDVAVDATSEQLVGRKLELAAIERFLRLRDALPRSLEDREACLHIWRCDRQ